MVAQPFVSFYLAAFAGAVWLVELCKLANSTIVAWYGRNSIVPMLVQMPFIWIIAGVSLAHDMAEYFTFAVIAVILSGVCVPVCRNRFFDIFK